jgi:hypothetical protein
MLFGEPSEVVGGWLWRNDMTGNRPELGLGCFGSLVEKARGTMESIAGGGSLLHCVVDFSWH